MIKRMIKGCPTESDAKASKRVPGLMDDQGASDRKSDAPCFVFEVYAYGALGRATAEVKHISAESTHSLGRYAIDRATTSSLVVAVLAAGVRRPVLKRRKAEP